MYPESRSPDKLAIPTSFSRQVDDADVPLNSGRSGIHRIGVREVMYPDWEIGKLSCRVCIVRDTCFRDKDVEPVASPTERKVS